MANKPNLIAIGGSIGTGKTTLAYHLKSYLQQKQNRKCVVIESDTERRLYLGYSLSTKMKEKDYSKEVDDVLYPKMDAKASHLLGQSTNVIRTMTGLNEEDYQKNRFFAEENNADFIGIFLVASEKNIRDRVKKRLKERETLSELSLERGHASDACEGVLLKYPIPDFMPSGWIVLDADQNAEGVFKDCIKALGL